MMNRVHKLVVLAMPETGRLLPRRWWYVAIVLAWLPLTVLAALDGGRVALVVNQDDPQSLRIADHYQQARGIPDDARIGISLPVGRPRLTVAEFVALKQAIDARTPARVQAFAVAWTEPFRVDCMSLTTALAFGFSKDFCSRPCNPTRASRYFDSSSEAPYTDLGIRPAMLLAGRTEADVHALIDRGVAADGSRPMGTAYLLITSDQRRNVRKRYFPAVLDRVHTRIQVRIMKRDELVGAQDVLMYFTGLTWVKQLDSLRFLPGAVADHLTSAGGVLKGGSQMTVLAWLAAGVTGSYGTVVEPCAFTQKFPRPDIFAERYTAGESLIEAYWKSVEWPGEGLFVGEPLARPWWRQ